MVYKLSRSSLSLARECPRCFWLKIHKNISRPKGPFPSLPSGFDIILKNHFDSHRDRNELPPELKDELDGVGLFQDKDKLKEWRNNFKGVRWEDEEGNVFFGAVDDILVKDGKLIVLDYKTRGFPLKEDTAEHYQDQLDVYTYLLRKNGFETEDYGYLIFYYPKEVNEHGDVVLDSELVKMETSMKNAEEMIKHALKIIKMKELPEKGEECEFCKWVEKLGEV